MGRVQGGRDHRGGAGVPAAQGWRLPAGREGKLRIKSLAEAASRMLSDPSVPGLPASLKATRQGAVGTLWLARSEKRNALDDRTILGIETYFTSVANDVKVGVLAAEGADFSAGLDLGDAN